jgi:hypothetical protein
VGSASRRITGRPQHHFQPGRGAPAGAKWLGAALDKVPLD